MFFSKGQKSMMYVKKVEGNQMKFRKAVSMFPFSTIPFQAHLYQLKISIDLYSATAYNRIRQSHNFVYGAQTFVAELIGIFLRSPYTKPVCRRIVPYTDTRIQSSYTNFVYLCFSPSTVIYESVCSIWIPVHCVNTSKRTLETINV